MQSTLWSIGCFVVKCTPKKMNALCLKRSIVRSMSCRVLVCHVPIDMNSTFFPILNYISVAITSIFSKWIIRKKSISQQNSNQTIQTQSNNLSTNCWFITCSLSKLCVIVLITHTHTFRCTSVGFSLNLSLAFLAPSKNHFIEEFVLFFYYLMKYIRESCLLAYKCSSHSSNFYTFDIIDDDES